MEILKIKKALFWISTVLLSIVMFGSSTMYFFKYDQVAAEFTKLGYPIELIYPLAILKFLGIIAILTKRSIFLKDLAYAGFFFNLVLAIFSHINANDGKFLPAILALLFLIGSYFLQNKKTA